MLPLSLLSHVLTLYRHYYENWHVLANPINICRHTWLSVCGDRCRWFSLLSVYCRRSFAVVRPKKKYALPPSLCIVLWVFLSLGTESIWYFDFSFPLFLPFLSEAHRIDILTSLFPEIFGESKFHDAIYVLPLIPTQPAYSLTHSLTHLLSPTCTCHGKEQVTRHLTYKPEAQPTRAHTLFNEYALNV